MKPILYFIIGLILIISGFLSFAFLGIITQQLGNDLSRHYLIVVLGFIIMSLGIISMIQFAKKT